MKARTPTKRKFTAKWLKTPDPAEVQPAPTSQGVNLMDRVFGESIETAKRNEKPPEPPSVSEIFDPSEEEENEN